MGHRGDSFLEIYILGIFGVISSNLSLDRCQKPVRGEGGQVFFKSAFLVFLVIFFKLELR